MNYINTNINPILIDDDFWIYEQNKEYYPFKRKNIGKWMLFYPKNKLNKYWQQMRHLYNDGKLCGVVSLKCSTNKENPRSSDNNYGVIILYCTNSENEDMILEIGRNILKYANYNKYAKYSYIYYKTDAQTLLGTRFNGQKRNYTYKLYAINDS